MDSSVTQTNLQSNIFYQTLTKFAGSQTPPSIDIVNNTLAHSEKPIYFGFLYRLVAVSIGCLIFLVGIIGNALVVIVISRMHSMQTPTNCYLLSLAMADCVVLFSANLPFISEPFFRDNEWPWGHASCSILVFLQYLGINASSLSMTAFTVERYIAICHPLRAHTMCTVARAKRIICSIWLFTILYCCPWLGLTKVNQKYFQDGSSNEECTFRMERKSYSLYYLIDLISFYIVPLLVAAILYVLMAWALFFGAVRGHTKPIKRGKPSRRNSHNSRVQVVRMLVAVVGVFTLLWMPYRVLVVYNSFANKPYLNIWFLLFCKISAFVNSAINPILYSALSLKFRHAFKQHLFCFHASSSVFRSQVNTSTVFEKMDSTTFNIPVR